MLALLFNEKRKMQISDVQLLLFYEPLSLARKFEQLPRALGVEFGFRGASNYLKKTKKGEKKALFKFIFIRTC